jgi:hypothetical protein
MLTVMFGGHRTDGSTPTSYSFGDTRPSHSMWGWEVEDSTPLDRAPGQRLAQWLDAYNSGEEYELKKFAAHYLEMPPDNPHAADRKIQFWIGMYQHYGRFELERVNEVGNDTIIAMVHTKADVWWRIHVRVSLDLRHRVLELTTQMLPKQETE